MALLHFENYESLNDASLPCKYSVSDSTLSIVTDTWAGNVLKVDQSGLIRIYAPDQPSTIIMGCLIKYDRLSNATALGLTIINIVGTAVTHIQARVTSIGQIQFVRLGGPGTVIGTTTTTMRDGIWYHLEIKTTISNSGSLIVNVDGVEEINFSGDTQNSVSSLVDYVTFGISSVVVGSVDIFYSNTYLCDDAGSTNNDFLGNIAIETLRPTADGTTNDFTPLNVGDNYVEVDEASPDGDSSYNSSSVVNDIDLFAMEDISNTVNNILATSITVSAKKIPGTSRLLTDVIRQGGTNYSGQGDVANSGVNLDYLYHVAIHETDPDTGVAWTESGVNSAETGYEIDS